MKKNAKTVTDKADLRDRQNALMHRIASWRKIQLLYMPCVEHLILPTADHAVPTHSPSTPTNPITNDPVEPQLEKLYLPSNVSPSVRVVGCAKDLSTKETRLRIAQAEDALYQIRRSLRVRKGLVHYKHIHVDGPSQARNT